MKIIIAPDPMLREVCAPVEVGDKSIKKLSRQMLREMYKADGVGLAAPQVGILKRFLVFDTDWVVEDEDGNYLPRNPHVLVNPEITDHPEEKVAGSEGCLSVPGLSVEIERYDQITVQGMDENFEEIEVRAEGLSARCLQHELDHLDGLTLFERLDPVARMAALKEYNEILAQAEAS